MGENLQMDTPGAGVLLGKESSWGQDHPQDGPSWRLIFLDEKPSWTWGPTGLGALLSFGTGVMLLAPCA